MTLRDLLEVQYSTADLDKVPDLVYTLRKVSESFVLLFFSLCKRGYGGFFFVLCEEVVCCRGVFPLWRVFPLS